MFFSKFWPHQAVRKSFNPCARAGSGRGKKQSPLWMTNPGSAPGLCCMNPFEEFHTFAGGSWFCLARGSQVGTKLLLKRHSPAVYSGGAGLGPHRLALEGCSRPGKAPDPYKAHPGCVASSSWQHRPHTSHLHVPALPAQPKQPEAWGCSGAAENQQKRAPQHLKQALKSCQSLLSPLGSRFQALPRLWVFGPAPEKGIVESWNGLGWWELRMGEQPHSWATAATAAPGHRGDALMRHQLCRKAAPPRGLPPPRTCS